MIVPGGGERKNEGEGQSKTTLNVEIEEGIVKAPARRGRLRHDAARGGGG